MSKNRNWPTILYWSEEDKCLINAEAHQGPFFSKKELQELRQQIDKTLQSYIQENWTDLEIEIENFKSIIKQNPEQLIWTFEYGEDLEERERLKQFYPQYLKYKKEQGKLKQQEKNKLKSVKISDLYLMQNTENKSLKIGKSMDCKRRRKDIETGSGCKTNLLYIVPKRSDLETSLHNKFSHLRREGEWFEYDPLIIQEFELLTTTN